MSDGEAAGTVLAHAALMDRIYRRTRHVYDASRKFFLLGRDRLIDEIAADLKPGDAVLEMGCGTARNLIKLAGKCPGVGLFGLDASREMLATARTKVAAKGLAERIHLEFCFAENADHRGTFGRERPFDAVFFSYSISMIPTWREALEAARRNLAPGKSIFVVDFYDQRDLPVWFRRLLVWWLSLFHVRYRPEMLAHLRALAERGEGRLDVTPIARRYAYVGRFIAAAGA